MYNYRPIGVYSSKSLTDEERKDRKNDEENRISGMDKIFSQIAKNIVKENPNIKAARLKEFYDQIIKDNGELLVVDNNIKEIYVKLLNFQVPKKAIERLNEIGGELQYIRGYDEKQSKIVNMDYFSVRIDKMPTINNQLLDANMLFKKIRDNFLTLSKGSKVFESQCSSFLTMKGYWEFKPYPKYAKEELRRWEKQLGASIFKIEAKSGVVVNKNVYTSYFSRLDPADHGAVLESEVTQDSWIFTTIFTPETDTQPFSGHRQFGIHKDEEGNYRFFTRAIDRIWPSNFITKTNGKECAVLDYLTIADATWTNLIQNVSQFINKNGGKTTILHTEPTRINFNNFFKKFRSEKPVNFIGNIEQFKTV